MKKNAYNVGLLMLCLLAPLSLKAQSSLNMQVIIRPPYSAYLDRLTKQAVLNITNNGEIPLTIYLRAQISNGDQFIRTKINVFSDPIQIAAHSTVTLNNVNFNYASFLGANTIEDNLTNAEINAIYRDKILPEGDYMYCIWAYTRDPDGNYHPISINGLPEGQQVCSSFPIFFAQPPVITAPVDQMQFNDQTLSNINFAWIPPSRTTAGSNIHYDLYIVKIPAGDDPEAVMHNVFTYHSNYYIKIPNITINNYVFNTKISPYHFEPGQRYAVMVQARDVNGKTFFENEGKSPVITFTTNTGENAIGINTGLTFGIFSPKKNTDTLTVDAKNALYVDWGWLLNNKLFDPDTVSSFQNKHIAFYRINIQPTQQKNGRKTDATFSFQTLAAAKKVKIIDTTNVNTSKGYFLGADFRSSVDSLLKIGMKNDYWYHIKVEALDDSHQVVADAQTQDFDLNIGNINTITLRGRLLYHFDDATGVNYPIPDASFKIYRRDIASNMRDSAYATTDEKGAFALTFDQPPTGLAPDSAEYHVKLISPYYQQSSSVFVVPDTVTTYNMGDVPITVLNYGLTMRVHEKFPQFYLGNDSVVTYNTGQSAPVDATKERPMPGLHVIIYRKSRPSGVPQHEGQDMTVSDGAGLPAGYIPVAEGTTTYKQLNGHLQTYVHFDHLICNLQKGDEYYARVVVDSAFRKLYTAGQDTSYDLVAPQTMVAFDPNVSDSSKVAGDTASSSNGKTHFEVTRDYYFLSTKPPSSVITGQLVYRWPNQKTVRPLANVDFDVRVEYLKDGKWTGTIGSYASTLGEEHDITRSQIPVTINGKPMYDNGFTVAHGHTDASGHFRIEVANFNHKGDIISTEYNSGKVNIPNKPAGQLQNNIQQAYNRAKQQIISPAGGAQNGAGFNYDQINFQGTFRGQYDLQGVFGGQGAASQGNLMQQGIGMRRQKACDVLAVADANGPGPNAGGIKVLLSPGNNGTTDVPIRNVSKGIGPYNTNTSDGEPPFSQVTYTRVFRIHLSYPYDEFYFSPDKNILVQAMDSINAGMLTAVVANQDLDITAVDAKTNSAIRGLKVLLFRDPSNPPLFTDNRPIGEGQELDVMKKLYSPNFTGKAKFISQSATSNGPYGGEQYLNINIMKPFYWVSDTTSYSNGHARFTHLYGLYPGYYVQLSSNPVNNKNYYKSKIIGGTGTWNISNINRGGYYDLSYIDEAFIGGSSFYSYEGSHIKIKMDPLPSRIAGRVMAKPFGSSSSNQGQVGLSGVTVSLFIDQTKGGPKKWQKVGMLSTSEDGYFEFLNKIPSDQTHFKLEVNAPGYHLDNAPDPSDPLNPVSLKSSHLDKYGQQAVLNPILMLPDGQLKGKIVDEGGNPVNAYVQVNDGPVVRTEETYPAIGSGSGFTIFNPYGKKIPKGTFEYPATPGKHTLYIYPMDPRYFNDTLSINVQNGTTQLRPITVYKRKHRILLQVNGPDGKPVPKARVYLLSDTPSVTDQYGQVRFAFENVSVNNYTLRVTGPAGSDYIPQQINMKNEESKKEIFYSMQLKQGSAISGQVLLDGQVVADAKVYLDYQEQSQSGFHYYPLNTSQFNYNGGNIGQTARKLAQGSLPDLEVFTDHNGHFTLHGIPLTTGVVTVHATLDTSFTVIGDEQQATLGNQQQISLQIHRYNGMKLQTLWGFPMDVESLTQESSNRVKLNARINIGKGHSDFKFLQDADELVRIRDVEFHAVTRNGQSIGEPVSQSVAIEALSSVKLGYLDRYNVLLTAQGKGQVPGPSTQPLVISRSGNGKGELKGLVHIVDNSFNYPSSYLNFTNKDQFYLSDSTATGLSNLLTALVAGTSAGGGNASSHRYHLSNAAGDSIRFSFINFEAHADPKHSFIDATGRIHLATYLQCTIPNAQPSHFTVQVPDITLDNNHVSVTSGSKPLDVQLEKWHLKVSNWTVDPSKGGIYSTDALLETGSIDVPVKFFNLRADMFVIDDFQVHDLSVGGGIEPLTLANATKANLFYDDRTGSDMGGHWTLSVVNPNPGQAAASLHGLTGLDPGTVPLQYVSLLSNGENIMSILQSGKGMQLYHVAMFNPIAIFSGPDYFSLQGAIDLQGPRLSPFAANLVYTGQKGNLKVKVDRVNMSFEGQGYMRYIAKNAAVDVREQYFRIKHDTTISYSQPIDTTTYLGGYVTEPGKIYPMPVDFIADGGPLGANSFHVTAYTPYTLPLTSKSSTDASSGYSLKLHWGHMQASASSDWNLYTFNGDMLEDGGGGTLSSGGHMTNSTFTVYGAIQADTKDVQVNNVPNMPGLKLDYNFPEKKLVGTLDFSKKGLDFGPVTAKGTAEFDIDPKGWYFLAGATMNAPVIGAFQAGVLLGNYSDINPHIKDVLSQAVENPRSMCLLPKQSIKGVFLTGEYSILNSSAGFTVPAADVSVTYNAVGSVGATVLFNIGNGGMNTDFEIRGYADVTANVSVPCTEIDGELKMAGHFVVGTHPVSSGGQQFTADGDLGAEVHAHLDAGVPGPKGCSTIFTGQVTKNAQVGIHYASKLHASFSLKSGGMPTCFTEK